MGATPLGNGEFGWKDLPEERVGERAGPLQERLTREGLRVGVEYRPHCNFARLMAEVRVSAERAGTLVLDGARAVGCDNRWGDGIFAVGGHFDANGRLVRVRVELGTEERQEQVRQLARDLDGRLPS